MGILGLHLKSTAKVMNFWSEVTCFGANWTIIAISMQRTHGGKFWKIYSTLPILFSNFLPDFGVLSLVIFGSILSNCVKSNNKDWVRLIMHSFCVFWAKSFIGGNKYSWTFMELLACFWALIQLWILQRKYHAWWA